MIYYHCEDLGCYYRLKNDVLELAPEFADGSFDTEDFGEREIGDDEIVTFMGKPMTIKEVEDNIIIPAIKKHLRVAA